MCKLTHFFTWKSKENAKNCVVRSADEFLFTCFSYKSKVEGKVVGQTAWCVCNLTIKKKGEARGCFHFL